MLSQKTPKVTDGVGHFFCGGPCAAGGKSSDLITSLISNCHDENYGHDDGDNDNINVNPDQKNEMTQLIPTNIKLGLQLYQIALVDLDFSPLVPLT